MLKCSTKLEREDCSMQAHQVPQLRRRPRKRAWRVRCIILAIKNREGSTATLQVPHTGEPHQPCVLNTPFAPATGKDLSKQRCSNLRLRVPYRPSTSNYMLVKVPWRYVQLSVLASACGLLTVGAELPKLSLSRRSPASLTALLQRVRCLSW